MASEVFVEWTMGLKSKGIESVCPGTTRLRIRPDGKIVEHRDSLISTAPPARCASGVGGFVSCLYR